MTDYYRTANGTVWASNHAHTLRDGETLLTAKAGKAAWLAQVRAELVSLLAGATQRNGQPVIYTVLRSASASGMSRVISAHVIEAETGTPRGITWHYAQLNGSKLVDGMAASGVRVQGGGMDMGYHLADCIASAAGIGKTGAEYPGFKHEWF